MVPAFQFCLAFRCLTVPAQFTSMPATTSSSRQSTDKPQSENLERWGPIKEGDTGGLHKTYLSPRLPVARCLHVSRLTISLHQQQSYYRRKFHPYQANYAYVGQSKTSYQVAKQSQFQGLMAIDVRQVLTSIYDDWPRIRQVPERIPLGGFSESRPTTLGRQDWSLIAFFGVSDIVSGEAS
jgi:hypothetical protein